MKVKAALAGSIFLMGLVGLGASNSTLGEGDKSFTPTRLEWLVLEVNTLSRVDFTSGHKFGMEVQGGGPDTVLVFVRYQPTVNREVMNTAIEGMRREINSAAKRHGWESWVKIREDVKLLH